MTHAYTVLVGGTVITGGGRPDVTAVAWAEDTILALGTDDEIRAISRGDSHLVDLHGAWVVPLAPGVDAADGASAQIGAGLEVGGRADLAVLLDDPRLGPGDGGEAAATPVALVLGGRVVAGALPGAGRSTTDGPLRASGSTRPASRPRDGDRPR